MNSVVSKFMMIFFFLGIHNSHALDIEIDPQAFYLDGYSFHLGIGEENSRFEYGWYSMEITEEIHDNKNFELSFKGSTLKYDYLLGKYEGIFLGWEINYAEVKYFHIATGLTLERKLITTAPRLGYRFVFYKSFTITPILALDIILNEGEEVKVGEDQFINKDFQVFPSVHIGYSF
jgi:hypothetical protein